MKILIAEDSSLIRRAIAKVIGELGFECVETENGAECLAALEKQLPDVGLIVLDWNMPVMDGFEVLTRIRSKARYDGVKIMMATSAGVEEDVVAAIKAGADSYLVKPFSPEKLSQRIQKLVG